MIAGLFSQIFFVPKATIERNRKGYVPLYRRLEKFYVYYGYRRVRDCIGRPICSVPGDTVTFKDRISRDFNWTFEFTGTKTKCINLGSYNYLGFAQNQGPCAKASIKSLEAFGVATCSSRNELGSNALHLELESLAADFLGVDDAIVFGMGFATNTLNLPCLLSPGCLAVSDEFNHVSIILGLQLSGASVRIYKHNDMNSLKNVIEKAILSGQPNGKPWRKILIITEGIFSMEGSFANLPEIVAIKKKYQAYLYVDEAHSVGATGPRGRGITDYFGIDPKEVDVLMGTFSKSFGSAGGYIAGNKDLIKYLRVKSHASSYASSMAPAVAQQIITSMRIIMGLDGSNEGGNRIRQLARNTKYFRRRLQQMGFIIHGHEDSPVIPMVMFHMSPTLSFTRYMIQKKIGLVCTGVPAVQLAKARIRFCISASHTEEQLKYVLSEIESVADHRGLKLSKRPRDLTYIEY